jgi:tetratricopeptide (TPR) repeat protein
MFKIVKTTSVLLVCLFSIQKSLSQGNLKDALQGEWVKEKLSLEDGSPVYNEGLNNSSFTLEFLGDSLIVSNNGQSFYTTYQVTNGTLLYGGSQLKIERLDKPILELVQMFDNNENESLKITLYQKPAFDLGVVPNFYKAKNGEPVYLFKENLIEPKFVYARSRAIDYIHSNFKYPEFKKGGFVVRFVVTKEGNIEGQRIMASSNHNYDQKLIDAINKTKGKWLPAKYLGEKVNTEIEFNFDLGYTKPVYSTSTTEDEKANAEEYNANGKYYFTDKNYKSAVYYFTKAINADPYLIDAYYLRAASHVFLQKTSSACADYLQLKNLGQKRGETLYDKYCGGYTPKTEE